MRLAFMGTPAFAVPSLNELVTAGHDVAAVYTQPPRPAGRGQKMRQSPVHERAEILGLPVRTPINFKPSEDRDAFAALKLDVAIVVAYGLILPRAILSAPAHGCLNLHASLLPRWRGAAPIHRAIMAGDTVTGVQVMQMESGLDTGPILLSESSPIHADDTTGKLHDRLSLIGAQMIPRALAALERGILTATPQAEDGVTYAHKISPDEAEINWTHSAHQIDCHIRGLSPVPGAWTHLEHDGDDAPLRIKMLFSQALETGRQSTAGPGTILALSDGILVQCGDAPLRISSLQRPGKAVQNADEFLRGRRLEPGMRFI